MGKTVGVDGVDQQHRNRLGPRRDHALSDHAGLAGGAAKPLVAVRAGDNNEQVLRIPVPEPGDVDREFLALRSAGARMDMRFEHGPAGPGRVEEFPPRLGIGFGEIFWDRHGTPPSFERTIGGLWRGGKRRTRARA